MKARFRIVQFSPDPFAGSRVTVGALVQVGDAVRFLRSSALPSSACVGDSTTWTTMNLALDAFGASGVFDHRSGDISQLATVGEPIDVPAEVDEPLSWVQQTFLPSRPDTGQANSARTARERRSSIGQRLFTSWGVEKVVRRSFRVEKLLGPSVLDTRLKHRPAHFVLGGNDLLLMEPFIGSRPSLEADLLEVKESFLAHQQLLQVAESTYVPQFVAYVVPRGYRGAMSDVESALRSTRAEVINVEDLAQRDHFVARIRELGSRHPGGLQLDS